MLLGLLLRDLAARVRRRPRRRRGLVIEGLEPRRALDASLTAPAVLVDSVTTADSRSVTVDYELNVARDAADPLAFGIYRSSDARFDASDVELGAASVAAAGVGHHQLTIALPNGLPPDPERPYVLAVADPASASASAAIAGSTAALRTHVIGVITHGGLQDKHAKDGPPWELLMAASLRHEGYDTVIPMNWVAASNHPGAASREGVRLAGLILKAASRFPATEPVDLHVIGHSEGTIVNTRALARLAPKMPPQLQAGYVKVTMLDPHAANTGVAGQQYSVASGPLGWLAKGLIDSYQSRARDPRAAVSPVVDDAEVFYQHTPASRAGSVNDGLYNLWGQVPVRGPAHYFNLTADGATHSGKTGVVAWYQRNVVPLLGDGAPEVRARVLTGALAAGGRVTHAHRAAFAGAALAGSKVWLFGGPRRDPSRLAMIGRSQATSDGLWHARSRPLANGQYRIVAVAVPPRTRSGPRLAMLPTAPLGPLIVAVGHETPGRRI